MAQDAAITALIRAAKNEAIVLRDYLLYLGRSLALPAGEAHIGQVGGNTAIVKVSGQDLGVAGTYANGDCMGLKFTFAAPRIASGSGVIMDLLIKDLGRSNKPFRMVIFDENPINTTFTDNAPLDIADADINKIIGIIEVATSDYVSFNDNSFAIIKGQNIPFKSLTGAATLYGILMSRDAPTYSANDLTIALGISQD